MSAFAALTAHTENRRLRVVLEQRQEDVRRGKALWEALAASPEIFPQLYVNMVKAGEASGQLAAVLAWLANYREQEQARRLQIRSALAYPTLLVVIGTVAVVLLVTLVVPRFSAMYEEFGQALPLPTVVLLAVAGWLGPGSGPGPDLVRPAPLRSNYERQAEGGPLATEIAAFREAADKDSDVPICAYHCDPDAGRCPTVRRSGYRTRRAREQRIGPSHGPCS